LKRLTWKVRLHRRKRVTSLVKNVNGEDTEICKRKRGKMGQGGGKLLLSRKIERKEKDPKKDEKSRRWCHLNRKTSEKLVREKVIKRERDVK